MGLAVFTGEKLVRSFKRSHVIGRRSAGPEWTRLASSSEAGHGRKRAETRLAYASVHRLGGMFRPTLLYGFLGSLEQIDSDRPWPRD